LDLSLQNKLFESINSRDLLIHLKWDFKLRFSSFVKRVGNDRKLHLDVSRQLAEHAEEVIAAFVERISNRDEDVDTSDVQRV